MPVFNIWKETFRVNTIAEGQQYQPDAVGLSNGNMLVVWTESSDIVAGGTGTDIMGQIYDPMGVALGEPIYLNQSYGNNRNEARPQVVATEDGGFIVTYNYIGNSEYDQLFRRYDEDGAPTGQQSYVVNDASGGTTYTDFEMVYRPDGSAVVTYRRDTGTDEDLMYRTIKADGTIGSEVEVRYDQHPTGNTEGDPDNPTAAVLKDGRVIVAFVEEDNNIYGAEYSIINTDGTVNMRGNVTPATTRQDDVDVAALEDGGWVITWREGNVLKGQIYNADNSKRGGALDLATGTDAKDTARVVGLQDGGFALSWIDRTDKEISTRMFDETGAQASNKADLVYGGFDAYDLDLALSADGRVMVSWQVYTDETYSNLDVMSAVLDPRQGPITVENGTPTTASHAGSDITGSDAADVFYGLEGGDDFAGKGGADSLFGGAGNDEISGGKGDDTLRASKGHDEVNGDKGRDQIWTGNGNDAAYGGGGRDQVWGGDGADKLWGGSDNDALYGGEGRDKVWGGTGKDKLYGGESGDTLWGNAGDDKITGGSGADKIIGGQGRDLMRGDSGADVFVFSAARDSGVGADQRDVILDFETNRDTIDLSAIDADTTRAGNQAFDFIGTDGFSQAGDLRARVANGDIYLRADRDGDGRTDIEIKLESPGIIDSFDFIL